MMGDNNRSGKTVRNVAGKSVIWSHLA
jgi:hypothetical protein